MSSPPRLGPERAASRLLLNRLLNRATGYELRRISPPDPAALARAEAHIEVPPTPLPTAELAARQGRVQPVDRLLVAPGFILSSVRSGSTLLRLILDAHPQICAPHELHLRRINATMGGSARYAMEEVGTDDADLRNLLWDRVLHRELTRSGKTRFVNKTPNDSLIWWQIAACWPDARFIYLRRHPAAILASWERARGATATRDLLAQDVFAYAAGMAQAEQAHGGLVVRYEDLTADPERETRRICEFLDVRWHASMIDYGSAEHTGLRRGLGDWSDKVRSGVVHPDRETPDNDQLPALLRPVAQAWGYLPADDLARKPAAGAGAPVTATSRTDAPWFSPSEEPLRR